jgi:hypothetical protein
VRFAEGLAFGPQGRIRRPAGASRPPPAHPFRTASSHDGRPLSARCSPGVGRAPCGAGRLGRVRRRRSARDAGVAQGPVAQPVRAHA